MAYLFYITVFIIIGIVIKFILQDDEGKAYTVIIIITIIWAFIWGPFAIAALIEMIIGYTIVDSYWYVFQAIGEMIWRGIGVLFILGVIVIIISAINRSSDEGTVNNNIINRKVVYYTPQEQCTNKGNIWNNQTQSCTILYSLTIQTNPVNARVRIMNIKPKYYDNIRLPEGRYDIMVNKLGFYSKRRYIYLSNDSSYLFVLDPQKVAF